MSMVAILFFRMRLISVSENLTPQLRHPANLVNVAGVVSSESIDAKNLSKNDLGEVLWRSQDDLQ